MSIYLVQRDSVVAYNAKVINVAKYMHSYQNFPILFDYRPAIVYCTPLLNYL